MSRATRSLIVLSVVVVGVLSGWTVSALAAEKAGGGKALPNPFYAYCVGIGADPKSATIESQLELPPMLAELGYSGMALVGLNGAMEMLQALEKHNQKLLAVYTDLVVDPDQRGYDPQLKQLIPKLKGHGTVVWLVVQPGKRYKPRSTEGDERAVELLREIADLAAQSGVAVSLYPHKGCYAERMEDVVRLAKKTERPNVGVTFTFCHFLAVDDAKNLDSVLAMARPYLNMVTINGTSGYDAKNVGWIQVLGEGSFDVGIVLRSLRKVDYRGPIGIIAYGIKGDRRDILSRSMQAWKKLSAEAAQ